MDAELGGQPHAETAGAKHAKQPQDIKQRTGICCMAMLRADDV